MNKLYQETIIVLAALAVLCWLLIQFLYVPRFTEIRMLQESLEKNNVRNVRIQNMAKNEQYFVSIGQKIERYHQEVLSLLPKQVKLSGLLKELSVLAKKNDVMLLSVKPLESSASGAGARPASAAPTSDIKVPEGQQFVTSDIEVVLSSSYENLGRYAEAIENNNLTVMTIKDIDISLDTETNDAAHLKVILMIEAYYKKG